MIRENAFEHKKKKPGLNLTPDSLSANRPSKNLDQVCATGMHDAFTMHSPRCTRSIGQVFLKAPLGFVSRNSRYR